LRGSLSAGVRFPEQRRDARKSRSRPDPDDCRSIRTKRRSVRPLSAFLAAAARFRSFSLRRPRDRRASKAPQLLDLEGLAERVVGTLLEVAQFRAGLMQERNRSRPAGQ
jgi:hypothetical protein